MKTTFIPIPTPPTPKMCVVELEPEDIKEILHAYRPQAYSGPCSKVLGELVERLRRESHQ